MAEASDADLVGRGNAPLAGDATEQAVRSMRTSTLRCSARSDRRLRMFRSVLAMVVGALLLIVASMLPRLVLDRALLTARTARPAEPPPSPPMERLEGPDSVRPVASYELRAKLDTAAHAIDGEGTIRFANVSSVSKDDLYVHLYLNAFESDDTIFGRRDASGFRGTNGLTRYGNIQVERFFVREMDADVWPVGATTEGDMRDHTDIRVPLPRSVAPGEVIHIDVRFKSTLPSVLLRTGFAGSFHMAGQWFPKLAKLEADGRWAHFPFQRFSEFYADFGDYDVSMDVPLGFVVGATGKLSEERTTDGRHVVRYRAVGVHDFAFAAWDGFHEVSEELGGVRLRCLFPSGYEASARKELDAARGGLDFYGRTYGAYPYDTLTLVHPPEAAAEAGGMEYPTLITTGGPYWLAYSGTRAVELLTLHELAHQWFYGLVATNENAFPFLDEGLTTFAAGEAAAALYGDHPLLGALAISVPSGERIYAKHVADRAPVASGADAFRTGSDYAQLVYYRTATALRTLDRVFPGVSSRAVAAYARGQRFGHPDPEALLRAFEANGGAEPRAALEALLYRKASIDLVVEPLERLTREAVVRRKGSLALPVDIDVTDLTGETRRQVWDGHGTTVTVTSPKPIVRIVADPEGKILLDENLLDNAATLDAPFAPRIFFASLFASALVATEVVP